MAMTLRLPADLDAKLAERARRTGRSKQDLAIEAIREAEDHCDVPVIAKRLTEWFPVR
ncbi:MULTISPECIES: ribbon-helix-helix protein, CopG family [Streptomyces]|uniref:Ribbon-helix-helix protein, CopG family n=1 Tax=Streptomyces koyangensis TaxID=188770 RepID=A0ABX7EFE8_9ACTN|nr:MULTISPECIES: ribbon-helix-helix protein, CopG family [Streptomyces]QRF03253.1 ribbon-helix-helix protein, CopG family [Streptomyces koyangensis]